MTTFQISSPSRVFSGEVGNVHFAAGRALADEVEHAAELAYFRSSGYAVEPAPEPEAAVEPGQAPAVPDDEQQPAATSQPAADQSTSKKGTSA